MNTSVDELACYLRYLGALAHSLPALAPYGERWPVIVHGEYTLGHMLPGVGLALHTDLKRIGITRGRLPYVLERSLWQRGLDWAAQHTNGFAAAAACLTAAFGTPISALMAMGTLTSYDSVVAALGAGRSHIVLWASGIDTISSTNNGLWLFPYDLQSPTSFTFSTGLSASAPSRTTGGAINGWIPAPTGSEQTVLTAVHELRQLPQTLIASHRCHMLVDVLYECGPFSLNTTSLQNLGTAALTRYTSGVGVFVGGVLNPGTSNVNTTFTISYTNSAGTSGRTMTWQHPGSFAARSMVPHSAANTTRPAFPAFVFEGSDIGVQSVETIQQTNSLASGQLALMLYKPLAIIAGSRFGNMMTTDLLTRMQPIVIGNDACLTLFHGAGFEGSFREIGSAMAFRFANV